MSDRNYHELLKELFDSIRVEKSNYLKNARGGEDKLVSCADALRIIVEHGVKAFRRKHTSPALLSHILLTLPLSNGQLCEPIAKQYIKVLRIFLEYRPHAEHLPEEEWKELMSLCLGAIESRLDLLEIEEFDDAPTVTRSGRRPARGSRASTPSSVNVSVRSAKKSQKKPHSTLGDQTVEDLLTCLSLLLSVPHLPVLDVADKAYQVLQDFLGDIAPSAQLQSVESAFSSINTILSWSVTENLAISKRITQDTLPQLRRLWHPKMHQGLKEQMLLFLVRCQPLLPFALSETEDFREELTRLLNVLKSEYVKRKELDLLTCDDLILGRLQPEQGTAPLANPIFCLRLGSNRAELAWILLSCVANIYGLLQSRKETLRTDYDGTSELPSKRRKTESLVDALLDATETKSGVEKMAHLQILTFLSVTSDLDPGEQKRLCHMALQLISWEDSNISSWSLIALSW